MKRAGAVLAMVLTAGLSACDGPTEAAPETSPVSEADAPDTPSPAPMPTSKTAPPVTAAADGAPDFAALYPGATTDAPATTATGPSGPGGMITFTTDAAPDAVVAFYRQRAESAGLSPVMAMNQGEARAYSAAGQTPNGPSVQVVASPGEGGVTSVQLTWSAGV